MGQEDEQFVGTPRPELSVKGVDQDIANLYNWAGFATRESWNPIGHGETVRSPHTRLLRGLEYLRYRATGARPDFEYFHKLDKFDDQFQIVNVLDITTENSGHQPLTYSVVELKDKENPDRPSKGTRVIIPAYSGTRFGVEAIARAWAEEGYKVITLDYPESQLGTPTEEFVAKIEQSFDSKSAVNYDPHTSLFEAAIEKLTEEDEEFGIITYSTGGPIAAEFGPKITNKVNLIVELSPASAVDQSKYSLFWGFRKEFGGFVPSEKQNGRLIQFFKNMVNTGIVTGARNIDDKKVQKLRERIGEVLLQKVCKRSDKFGSLSVKPGGKVIYQLGGKDEATKSLKSV